MLPDEAARACILRVATRETATVWRRVRFGLKSFKRPERREHADVAQLVAHHLAKVRVASSSLVIRSSAGMPIPGNRDGHHVTWVEPHTVAWPSG